MKSFQFISVIFITAAVSFFSLCGISFAADLAPVSEIDFKEDLGIAAPVILPNSSFYFLKEWHRAVSRFFAFGQIKKIRLESEILNQKAAEIKSLNIFSADPDIVNPVITEYKKNVLSLNKMLESFKAEEVKEDLNPLLNSLIRNLAVNVKYFDELEFYYNGPQDVIESLAAVKKELNKALAVIPNRLDSPDSFSERLLEFAENFPERIDLSKELRTAEMIAGIEEYLTPSAVAVLQQLKEELLIKFQIRIQNEDDSFLKARFVDGLSGNFGLRVKILDEVREKTADVLLKNLLNSLRQEVLNNFDDKGVGESAAQGIINLADTALAELEQKIKSGDYLVSSSMRDAVKRANFNLEQAKIFFEVGDYGGAFGQASSALAASRSAANKLKTSLNDFEEDFKKLRLRFDEISQKTKQKDQIKSLENLLVSLSEMVKKKSGFDKINTDFEKALKLMGELEELVNVVKNWIVEIGDNGGFSPVILKIKKGDSVIWKNSSVNPSWPASAVHPDHKAYPEKGGCLGSKFDSCRGLKQGESFTFIFNHAGSWNYHD
ncbi:MAG: DUF5667 domain-containing protein, partial [Patescibacteria group bacterium]